MFDGLWTLAQDLAHGGGYVVTVPAGAGYSVQDVEGLLRSEGIDTWGANAFDYDGSTEITVTVPKSEAAHAEAVLAEAGLPIVGGTTGVLPFLPGGSVASEGQGGGQGDVFNLFDW